MYFTMQIILGSGGAIGRPLARALADYTDHVICASRTPHALPTAGGTTFEHRTVDLLDADAVRRAVAGCEVAYLTAGLRYRTAVWRAEWPRLIRNVIAAVRAANAKLVFFDNVYALGAAGYANMTAASPLRPTSAKGEVRRRVLDDLAAARAEHGLRIAVARAADFYGPGIGSSLLQEMVVKRHLAGSSGLWPGPTDQPHSFTYTPDAARALARLGNDARAWGRTWHLPTDPRPWTLTDFATALGERTGCPARVSTLPKLVFWLLARFSADLRELYDVRRQYDRPYRFVSQDFTDTFGLAATPYEEGLATVIGEATAG